MEPAKGLVQPIVYRAPEVYFRNEINQPADIWSWGLIYCQLLEAQASFNKYGIYDELLQGNAGQGQKERSVERAIAHDFGLGALDYYDGCRLPYHDRTHHEGQHWERLMEKGVPEKEIKFLSWVLNPVPTDRPTAKEILEAGWFTMDHQQTGRIAESLQARAQESRRRNIHRKRSEPMLPYFASAQQPSAASTQPTPYTPFSGTGTPQQTSYSQYQAQAQSQGQSQGQPQGQVHQPTPYQPMSFIPVNMQARDDKATTSRPGTPRSSSQKPGGGTYMSYGSFMR